MNNGIWYQICTILPHFNAEQEVWGLCPQWDWRAKPSYVSLINDIYIYVINLPVSFVVVTSSSPSTSNNSGISSLLSSIAAVSVKHGEEVTSAAANSEKATRYYGYLCLVAIGTLFWLQYYTDFEQKYFQSQL